MESITIEISLPPKELSPNARCHWRTKNKAFKAHKAAAHYACAGAIGRGDKPMWKAATLASTFYLPNRRGIYSDDDNRIGSMKAARDGIATAGVVENDRGIRTLTPVIDVDAANPRLVLTITRSVE